jgi:hypothetical protein
MSGQIFPLKQTYLEKSLHPNLKSRIQPELEPDPAETGTGDSKRNRIRNKSVRIHNTDFKSHRM